MSLTVKEREKSEGGNKKSVIVRTSDGTRKKIIVEKGTKLKEFLKKLEKEYGVKTKEFNIALNGKLLLTDKNGELEENPILEDGDLVGILQKGFAGAKP